MTTPIAVYTKFVIYIVKQDLMRSNLPESVSIKKQLWEGGSWGAAFFGPDHDLPTHFLYIAYYNFVPLWGL